VGYLQLAHPKKLSPKYMLIGLFFLRVRERGVRKERGEGQIAQITLGSKQLKNYYFIRELFS
jgi:hypothetical protein